MKFYEVVTKFSYDGRAYANIFIVYADEKPENTYEKTEFCNMYKNYFTDPVEAENWQHDALITNIY